MRVCILEAFYEEAENEQKTYEDGTYIAEYLIKLGHTYEFRRLQKANAAQQLHALISSKEFDVFINLCDGTVDDEAAGIEVVQILEAYNVPFTGADSRFYDPSRKEMKQACHLAGIKTPAYEIVTNMAAIPKIVQNLQFPLIVKHYQSYASIGLLKESRVESEPALSYQVARMLNQFGKVLIEEFIDGREFTVLVVENPENAQEPIVYVPIEVKFPLAEGDHGFKYYDLKWVNFREMHEEIVSDPYLARHLQELSQRIFTKLNGTGYGRCDFRMNQKGEIFLLEINPNCGIFYNPANPGSADFILLNDSRGHVGFTETILRSALNRVQYEKLPMIKNPVMRKHNPFSLT